VVCKNLHCQLVQLPAVPDSPFTAAYPYRSGQSAHWLKHLEELVAKNHAQVGLNVLEVGGNDGSLCDLVEARGKRYYNVDPTASGHHGNIRAFMDAELPERYGIVGWANWVVANNVMAHVPDLDSFLAGIRAAMAPDALLTVEVPDLEVLIKTGAWDTIYHEHYSYFTRSTAFDALERRGFFVSHSESIPTHGGSIRVYAHKVSEKLWRHPLNALPLRIMKPLPEWPTFDGATPAVDALCLQASYIRGWMGKKRVVGYGAPAKASTFLNFFDIGPRAIEYIVDSTPEKIGKFTPGSHIEIMDPSVLQLDHDRGKPPDIVVILAWNWAAEIIPKIPEGPEVWCRGERLR
jgi:hypothetical protein